MHNPAVPGKNAQGLRVLMLEMFSISNTRCGVCQASEPVERVPQVEFGMGIFEKIPGQKPRNFVEWYQMLGGSALRRGRNDMAGGQI